MHETNTGDPLTQIIAMATELQAMDLRESDLTRLFRVQEVFERAYRTALHHSDS